MASKLERTTKELATKLKKEKNLSKQEIRNGVKDTREKYHPLLTSNKTGLIVFAREEHGLKLVNTEPPKIDIENIVEGIVDGDLEAKVENVDKFSYHKDGEDRRGCEVLLKDNTGVISMMAWQDDVEDIDRSIQGEKIRVEGFRSSRYEGDVQLTFSEKTEIEIIA